MTDVFMDGEYVGVCDDPEDVRDNLIEQRRESELPREIGVRYDAEKDELRVSTDGGRVQRPLVIVEDGTPKITGAEKEKLENGEMTIYDLAEDGVIEFLDAEEEEDALVALTEEEVTDDHTHMELDPIITHGLSSALVCYANYNRGDRVNYGAKMVGQGLGLHTTNFPIRYDTNANMLMYGQKPLVTTATADMTIGDRPLGQNMVVALASHEGYNMEDGVIINKASVERGLARSYYFRTYTTEARRYWGGQRDEVGVPDKDVRGYRSEQSYAHLAEDGLVHYEDKVDSGDVLIGKMSPPKFLGSSEEVRMGLAAKRETSTTVRHSEQGYVDSVMVSETSEGTKLVKVRLREERIPELGDKFATRHGQKGVIGLLVPQEDMPFTQEGITPDLILSTHAIPSRMTVSQLLEVMGGKVAALRGEEVDGTTFNVESEEDLKDALLEMGFRHDGKETMYNGVTGEKMDVDILIGPAYYLKLHHMVGDKIHARSRGPVTLLTKQPTAGRAREGGLRLGEMEKDCFVGHGASLLLQERFSSDSITVPVCQQCGGIGTVDKNNDTVKCQMCKSNDVENTTVPAPFVLLLDELKSLMIATDIEVET